MTRPRGLREWRLALGLNQADVAWKIGFSPTMVSQIEHGKNRSPAKFEAMREALLNVAREKRNDARWHRREERLMRAIAEAWDGVPAEARQKVVHALWDLAWHKLDAHEPYDADGIGLAMPPDVYQALLDEYFEEE